MSSAAENETANVDDRQPKEPRDEVQEDEEAPSEKVVNVIGKFGVKRMKKCIFCLVLHS